MNRDVFRTNFVTVGITLLLAVGISNASAQKASQPVVVGKTTYSEAVSAWTAGDFVITQSGNLAVGAGSGVDGAGSYSVAEVQLIDVSGVDFEGLKLARFGFVDGTLFSITAHLQSMFRENQAGTIGMSSAELQELEKRLRAKYGPPTQSLKDMFSGKKPNILVWDLHDRELILHLVPGVNSSLELRSKALSEKAGGYARSECRKHRPKCAI